MNSTIELLQAHRSIRAFQPKTIPQNILDTLIQAGQAAATSSFIQACTVIQIEDPHKRAQLAACAGNQPYVESAPVFLVFCADMQRHKTACEMNNAEMQSGFTEQFLTASLDCGLFAQNVVVAAESLGLGSVYIGGIRNEIATVAELLALPDLVYPVFGLCLGYPDQHPQVKPRLPLSIVLKKETYSQIDDAKQLQCYDEQVRDYYLSRTGGTKDMTWTGQIAGMLTKESRQHMLTFLQSRGFLLK